MSDNPFWTSQIISNKSSNSVQNLQNKYSSSPSSASLLSLSIQQQRELKQQQLNDQHEQQLNQQQLLFSQQNRSKRSLVHLPSAANYNNSNSYQAINNINNSNSNLSVTSKNALFNYSSGNRNENYKSLDDFNQLISYDYSRISSRYSSKFNLEGANGFSSYDHYVNERSLNKPNSPDYTITNADLEIFNKITGEDLSIDDTKWLEEKPISVLQLDQPDRAVLKIADQRDKIQKKTFTKWINKYLNKQTVKINDLFEDLRDGVCLISLLQLLSNKEINKEKGKTRFHALQNVHRCLDFLEDHNIKLVNIRPDEIVDGNPKLTLGLIWIIILNFQISGIVGKDVIARDALINWSNKHLEPYGIYVQDFTNSWKDGKAFLGILHRHRPDKFNWESIKLQSNKQNLQLAFNLAENEFKVTKLLDPEDVDVSAPDERSILTYVSSLYEGLPALKPQKNQSEKEKEKRGLIQEYSMLFKILARWLNQSIESMNLKSPLPSGYVELKGLIADLKCFRLEEYANKIKEKKKLSNVYGELQSYHGKNFSQVLKADEELGVIENLWEKLDLSLQNREHHLELAISKSEKMRSQYENSIQNTDKLDLNLETLKNKLDDCLSRFDDKDRNKRSMNLDLKRQLDKIESEIHCKEVEIRKALIEAYKLREDNHPDSKVLIESLKRSEKVTIGLLVKINDLKTFRPAHIPTSSTPSHQYQYSSDYKKLDLISPPSSIVEKSSSSNLSTPSQSITVSSASNESNSLNKLKSSAHYKSTTHYYELSSITTPSISGSHPNNTTSLEDYSPKSPSNQESNLYNLSTNLSKPISLLNKTSNSQDSNSVSDNEIIDLINDSFSWIRSKQLEIDSIKIKPDLFQIQIDLDVLFQLKNELTQQRTNIETIELLKMNYAETSELTDLINQLNLEYLQLCTEAKTMKKNLESLNELIKLVHDELHYLNEIEHVELTRDWSQPNKLNLNEILKHKKQVEQTLSNKKMAYAKIMKIAGNLIESKHPAVADINAYVSALKTGKIWLLELMNILSIHTGHLKKYDAFMKSYNELDFDLSEVCEKFNNLTNSTAYNLSTWNDSLREDFTNQFNQFNYMFQDTMKFSEKIDHMYESVHQLPSYKLRRINLKSPYNKAKILTKYSQIEFTIERDEMCRIEDNSNPLNWKVLSINKNRHAEVPSLCFILNGPDAELLDLIDKLKFKYEQLTENVKKFDINLKKEKVSRIMKEILNDSQSSKLQYITRASVGNLIQTVKDEISLILSSREAAHESSNEIFDDLIKEFDKFNKDLNRIVDSLGENELNLSTGECNSEESIEESNTYKKCSNVFNLLQAKLDRLYELFRQIVNDQFILHIQTANNHSIRKNLSLESKFQQFQHNEFKNFEKDLKSAEKNSLSVNDSSSNLSTSNATNSNNCETGSSSSSLNPNDDLKSKLTHVKSKYQNLIHLSNLYSQSFSNLDSLSKIVDDFISDMCKIEIKLAGQSLIENVNINSDLINKEYESLQEVKGLFKLHENDLMVMKSYYDELKLSMDKVRSRNLEQEKFSLLSVNSPRNKHSEERQSEDLLKLDLLIKQLTDRWNHSLHFYRSRRSNLRECQKAYEEFQHSLKQEKDSLNSFMNDSKANTIEQKNHFLLDQKKSSVEVCNQKAAQFVQLAKDLNCQIADYKTNLIQLDDINKTAYESTESLASIRSEFSNEYGNETSQIRFLNQSLFLNVWNEINELNRSYFELLNPDDKDINPNELSLNDIFLSHFDDTFRTDLNLLNTPLDIEPDFISTELTEDEMQNYKDFCGSQEWQFQLNKLNNSDFLSKSSNSINKKNSKSTDSSSSSSSSLVHNQKPEPQSFLGVNEFSSIDCEFTNFYHSSLISDYRLTLTDLLDLNLIDISNGFIINPLTGRRLSIADAIRIDLLNSDVKEIANTFLDAVNTSIKLTVREAIKIEVLNPFRNEIQLSPSNPKLKLNIYEARKRNMILKPLTLSEAFIRNLIQPNGFVRNPINNKYYAFETLIFADMEHNRATKNKELESNLAYYGTLQHFVFDFDTKHIIDPNDSSKRLLSLTEAVNIGLIIPRTFELSLTTPHYRRVNLYDAFFNIHNLKLNLLLYKPEIDNVYVKLTSNLFDKNEYLTKLSNKKSQLSVLLSRREKIGLVEAMNLNVIDLKALSYAAVSESTDLTTLNNAIQKYELVDAELLEILNTPVNVKNLTIRDYINDLTVVLDKYLVKSPNSNDYFQFDSYNGKAILSETLSKRIKRLITRINIKSYIISLRSPLNVPKLNNPKVPAEFFTNKKLAPEKTNRMENITSEKSGKKEVVKIVKTPALKPPISSFYFGQNETEDFPVNSPKKSSIKNFLDINGEASISKDSITSVWLPSSLNEDSLVPKSYVLDYIVNSNSLNSNEQRFSVPDAIKRGILDVNKGCYKVNENKEISIDQAIKLGYIGTREINNKETNHFKPVQPIQPQETISDQSKIQQSSTLAIESVIDASTGKSHSINEAIRLKILDQFTLNYTNSVTGEVISLDEAFKTGFAMGKFYDNGKVPKEIDQIKSNTILTEREEKSFKIESVFNSKTNQKVTLDIAIKEGIFDKQKGLYIDPITKQAVNLNEAVRKGCVSGQYIDDSDKSLKINVSNKPTESSSQLAADNILYEVNEIEEVMFVNLDEKNYNSNVCMEENRIEQVIDDEDYDDLTSLDSSTAPVKKRMQRCTGGLYKNILERRIPSVYGDKHLSETLVIDDVRHSAMINIDGVTHVCNEEVLLDSDTIKTSNQIVSTDSLSSFSQKSDSSQSCSTENAARKTSNRSVIVVDDQMFNGEYLRHSNTVDSEENEKCKKNNAEPRQAESIENELHIVEPITTKTNDVEGKILYDNICQILESLGEYEFELARQNALPDAMDTLIKQTADFEKFTLLVKNKTPFFNDVIVKIKEFASNPQNEASKLKADLVNFSNEASYRLKMVTTEIEKRSISFESASIHLNSLNGDRTRFQEWLNQTERKFSDLKKDYNECLVHDLNNLQRFEKEAKTLEIILFSRQDDLSTLNQHFKSYSSTTDYFNKDLKNFCVKLKNNRINRLSSDMMSDLTNLKQSIVNVETSHQKLYRDLNEFKAKLMNRIESNIIFDNSCMKLDLWLNEFEPKFNNEINKSNNLLNDSNNNEGNVRKLEDTYKRFQLLQTDIHNKKMELDDIKSTMNKVIEQAEAFNFEKTKAALEGKSTELMNRYDAVESKAAYQCDILLKKLTNMRNLKENVDSATKWLNELDHVYLNGSHKENPDSEEDKLEAYDRIKSDLESRKEILVRNLSNDPEAKHQLNELLFKIDKISNEVDAKSLEQKNFQDSLDHFNTEYDRLDSYCKEKIVKIDSVDVITGIFNEEKQSKSSSQLPQLHEIKNCIEKINNLYEDVLNNEQPKVNDLQAALDELKLKYSPNMLREDKFKLLQEKVAVLKFDFQQLAECSQLKKEELQNIHDFTLKYSKLKSAFEAYLQETETKVLGFEAIGVDIEVIESQLNQLHDLIGEFEKKSQSLDELNEFTNFYLSVISRVNESVRAVNANKSNTSDNPDSSLGNGMANVEARLSNSSIPGFNLNAANLETDVSQELSKLNQLYEWIGDRFEERKRDLSNSLINMKTYLEEVHLIESQLNEFEKNLKQLFAISDFEADVKFPLDYSALEKIGNESQKINAKNRFHFDVEISKLQDRSMNYANNFSDIKSQIGNLTTQFSRLTSNSMKLNEKLDSFMNHFKTYEIDYDQLQSDLETTHEKLNNVLGDRAQSNATVDISLQTIENDSLRLKELKNNFQTHDHQLCKLNQNGNFLLENSLENKDLNDQLKTINDDFELILNDLKSGLKYKTDLLDLSDKLSTDQKIYLDKLNSINLRLKNLGDDEVTDAVTEDGLKSILNELDNVETYSLKECDQVLDNASSHYNQIQDLIHDYLSKNGAQSDLRLQLINLVDNQTPDEMRKSLETAYTKTSQMKSDYSNVLKNQKAFDVLHIDLSDFVNSKLKQLENSGKLSTQSSRLKSNNENHDCFTGELNSRSDDVNRLIEFYNNKIKELNEKNEPENINTIKLLLNEIETNWNHLRTQADSRKEKLLSSLAMSELFELECKNTNEFFDKCQTSIDLVNSNQNNDFKIIFDDRIKGFAALLENLNNTVDISKVEKCGSALQNICELDLDLVDKKLDQIKNRFETIETDLNGALENNRQSADYLKKFNEKVDRTDKHMSDLDIEISEAISKTASESLQVLENLKAQISNISEDLNKCKELSLPLESSGMKAFTNDVLNKLDNKFITLDGRVDSKLKETGERVAEINNFQNDLTRMDEKLRNIQAILNQKSPKKENNDDQEVNSEVADKTNDEVIDEASLRAKQAHLESIKESLITLDEQLKIANDNLDKYLSNGNHASDPESNTVLEKLQKTVQVLSEKSNELSDLQQKEESIIKEKSEQLENLTGRIFKCNEDINKCSKDFDNVVASQKTIESPLITKSSIQTIITEHEQYQDNNLKPIKTDVISINKDSSDLFNIDVNKPNELKSPVGQCVDIIQMTSLELKLEKLNFNFNKLDGKFESRAKQLDLALFKSAKFENKLDFLNENFRKSELKIESLNKTLFDFGNLSDIDLHLTECDALNAQLAQTSVEIDDFKEICEKLMQNCDSPEDRDIIEKRMDSIIYKWNIQTLQLDEKKANLKFLNTHLKELNEGYLEAKVFTDELNLKFTSELSLNCIEPIVIKSTQEKMKDANEVILERSGVISELKIDTNNLLSIYEDYEKMTSQENVMSENKLITHLPKTISSPQLFGLACMLNKPDIEANVHDIDFKYSDYKFHLSKNLDLMQRLYPLCENFSQTIAQLNQSFAKLEAELEWLENANDNETSQKEKEILFNELQTNIVQNNEIIADLEQPISARIIEELNTTNNQCDEFIQDLNDNIKQVKGKYAKVSENLNAYALVFEEQKLKVRELFAEMDDLLEWLDNIDVKFNNLELISHEPEVIKIQLNEQKALNEEILNQNKKLKEIIDLSKSLIRNKYVEDSIELKEKLSGLQLQSNNLSKLGGSRLNELEHALAIAESFYQSYRMIDAWFDEIKEDLVNVEKQHSKESLASEPKEAIKMELGLLKKLDRSLQEKKVDFETMNKNGFALARICNKSNGIISVPSGNNNAGSPEQKNCQSAQQLKESIQYSNDRYEKFKMLVAKRKEELEALLWKSAEFTEKLDNLTNSLNNSLEMCEYAEAISAHPDKLRLQIDDNKVVHTDLDKRKQALDDIRDQAINESIENRQFFAKNNDMLSSMTSTASNEQMMMGDEMIEKKLNDLDELWYHLKELAESRSNALEETLHFAETFWSDFHSLMDVISDLEDRLKQIENETVAMDPDSVIEQQQHQEDIVREIDENEQNIQDFKDSGSKLIELCGQYDHPEVEKTVEELENAWSRIKQLVRDREIELQHTFGKACEFQQELIEILEWISLQQEKFINLDSSFTSNDPKTIRFQINLLKEFKDQIDPEQIKIQLLNQKFNDLKTNTKTNQSFDVLASLQEPLNSANKEWKRLQNGIVERKANLQNALLDMGQFNEALDEMLKWLERTDQSLDEVYQNNSIENEFITSNQLVSSIDIQLAKLKVLKNDINAQEQSVEKLKETGKNLIKNETTGKQTLQEIKTRVQLLIDSWESLLLKLQEKQSTLNSRLLESNTFQCELQDALNWLADIESQSLNSNKPTGGLPETAREQLDKFMQVYDQIQTNEEVINSLIETGKSLTDKGQDSQSSSQSLNQSIEMLGTKWTVVRRKADERKEKLESTLQDANEFHTNLQNFIAWLTDTEKNLNLNKPVSKVLDMINEQVGEHQLLQKNITEHRAQMIALDTLGFKLKYFSQKQDVILIKNVLISVQNRWEKIVSRSAERTRDLERGYKESKLFTDNWTDLIEWLNTNLNQLAEEHEATIGNNPIKIKQYIAKHKEFHRSLGQKQPNYDLVVKLGRKLIDKCDMDASDRPKIQEMMNDAKTKWQTICYQSAERQKKLEDALLCSGQLRDALQSLLEWLSRVEPTLADNMLLNGDLESVLALIEDNQQFQQQLQYKADQVHVVRKAANEMLLTNRTLDGIQNEDGVNLQEQLDEMNDLWSKVDELSKDRTQRLDTALKLAKEFNAQVRSRLEWLSTAEQILKFSPPIPIDNENDIIEQIECHQNFVRDFKDQEALVKQCLNLGQELLETCTPESIVNLKHSIAVVQSRFDEINQLSEQRCKRLSEALEQCKENEQLLGELLVWVQGAEATLVALEQVKIANNLEQTEQLLSDHQEFQTEMQSRQLLVERITKNSLIKDTSDGQFPYQQDIKKKSTSIRSLNKMSVNSGWRTPEPKMKNPRVVSLFNRWRKVWLMALDRQRKLKEAMDRQREMERLKNFNFDDWRRRYMNWHKDNRARITDFFRRQDRDHDGKISREEFIEGILSSTSNILTIEERSIVYRKNFPSSRLELEAVADKFDLNKDGYIDYKEFLATLKPTSNTEPNFERIRDEVQRQVSLCKCSKRYHVLQISDRQYRFGDSQKLRLVRILQSTVMVRVGGGWMALDEFLVKNDPCRGKDIFYEFIKIMNKKTPSIHESDAKGRTNMDLQLRENFLLKEISQQNAMNGIFRSKSPNRMLPNVSSPINPHNKKEIKSENNTAKSLIPISERYLPIDKKTHSRSGASSSSTSKRTPRSSLSQSNEVLILAASMPSEANSNSESLGASISDLSSEATSEFSDNYSLNPSNINNHNSKSILTDKSGTSTPTKNQAGSRLPVYKKMINK